MGKANSSKVPLKEFSECFALRTVRSKEGRGLIPHQFHDAQEPRIYTGKRLCDKVILGNSALGYVLLFSCSYLDLDLKDWTHLF